MIKKSLIGTMTIFFLAIITAHAEFFIDGYGGGVGGFAKSCGTFSNTNGISGLDRTITTNCSYKLNITGLLGMKLGGWYGQKNDYARCRRENFGCYLDANYHTIKSNCRTSQINYLDTLLSPAQSATAPATTKLAHGGLTTLSFLFSYRYLFDPNRRRSCVEPYIAFGPSAVILTHNKFLIAPHEADNGYFTIIQSDINTLSSKTHAIPGLVLDTGLNFVTCRGVLLDLFFKYRFAKGRWVHNCDETCSSISLNLLSLQLGVGYSF